MNSNCVVPTREKLSEGRLLSFSKSNINCKHVGMAASPEIFFEDGQLFIWCKSSDIISGKEFLK